MSTTTPNLGLFKYNTSTDGKEIFSIKTALNDNWDIIDEKCGSGKNIGEIVTSTVPLTDAGLHLLDGSLIQGDGIYSDFVEYTANIYKTKDRIYNSSAFTIVGNPSITSDGIASGFDTSNYLKISDVTVNNKDFEVSLFIKTAPTQYSTSSIIFDFNATTLPFKLGFSGTNNRLYLSSSGGSSSPLFTTFYTGTLLTDTIYYIKTGVNDTKAYLSYSTDNKTWNTYQSTSFTENLYTTFTNNFIGKDNNSSVFANSSIYLKQLFITVDNMEAFNGSIPANYFTDETTWQTAIGTYGVCGKFVYNSTNNTVRLPKITGKLDGTTDVNALGELIEQFVKLPNILADWKSEPSANANGAVYITSESGNLQAVDSGGSSDSRLHFDASRSSEVYSGDGTNTKIHEQAINVLYYIVIATSTKTDIQVDIDQIATDLNGKCDKADLMECQVVVEDYQSGGSWYRVYSDGWCEQGASGVSITSGQMAIYFLKPFMDNHYTLITEINGVASTSYGEGVSVQSKLTDSFLCHGYHSSAVTAVTADWYACGYIEVA